MQIAHASTESLREWEAQLTAEFQSYKNAGLNLDLTRGKPSGEQLSLSDAINEILAGDLSNETDTDLRNYGGLDGIPECKRLFAPVLGVNQDEVLIGGNSSLTLMYFAVLFALHQGFGELGDSWASEGGPVKFLCPVPGYDRHFSVCEHLGIEMIPVGMDDNGPLMDEVEALLKADASIKGIWCVPRFSNPSGIVYSDEVVTRIAKLGQIAGKNFRVFWDNAYAVHNLDDNAPALACLMTACRAAGTENSVYLFGSTSKITYAGAGVAFAGMSPANLKAFKHHLGMTQIGPDKINQLRHVRLLKDSNGLAAHMRQHANVLKPRFDIVLNSLQENLADTGMMQWTVPQGGYFVSVDTLPGLAKKVVAMAAEAGVKLTPAGATYPYGKDPQDCNIRIAPSVPTLDEIAKAMDVFVCCVKLASVQQKLAA
ncbi:aminotransferase class I/II-fold pyridoxal phosphate-dependent enzyme [Spongiibacter sp. KMU-158]|uniref:Aminotransferase class I/II-fold pyridoxal phosphate-dependent enzyme n=1 Tax=Spongiibacter pelagi TaxID=2760804 RepID=A0A927GWA4_9GAMM|nr:aminotransferase class I/II-fold pyridoxal phosphate-dependent enzyme [Spongiibacter pelagi]MBD2858737.1 aminotransferase class I/II-fold pyridoxal phosphate-dependent enzyme [Spongiibacter pelagi]